MIRIDGTAPGAVRISGALKGSALSVLLRNLNDERLTLDLSEVRDADADAVRILSGLPPARCELVGCPRWLALWIERERRRS